MKLTLTQRRLLQFYNRHRSTPLSIGTVIRSHAPSWILMAITAVASYGLLKSEWPLFAGLYIGICGGAFLRDVSRLRTLFHTWPITRAVLDGDKVEKLLEAGEIDDS